MGSPTESTNGATVYPAPREIGGWGESIGVADDHDEAGEDNSDGDGSRIRQS
jgi:hypothetical protein